MCLGMEGRRFIVGDTKGHIKVRLASPALLLILSSFRTRKEIKTTGCYVRQHDNALYRRRANGSFATGETLNRSPLDKDLCVLSTLALGEHWSVRIKTKGPEGTERGASGITNCVLVQHRDRQAFVTHHSTHIDGMPFRASSCSLYRAPSTTHLLRALQVFNNINHVEQKNYSYSECTGKAHEGEVRTLVSVEEYTLLISASGDRSIAIHDDSKVLSCTMTSRHACRSPTAQTYITFVGKVFTGLIILVAYFCIK